MSQPADSSSPTRDMFSQAFGLSRGAPSDDQVQDGAPAEVEVEVDDGTFEADFFADVENDVATEEETEGEEAEFDEDGDEGVEESEEDAVDSDRYKAAVREMNEAQRERAELRKELDELKAQADTQQASPAQGPAIPNPYEGINPAEIFENRDDLQGIEAAAWGVVSAHLMPQLQPFAQAVQELYAWKQQSEQDSVASRFENAAEVKDAAQQFLRDNPKATPEQAYRAVGGREVAEGTVKRRLTKPRKQTPLTRGASGTSVARPVSGTKWGTSNGADVVREEMRKLRRGT